MKLKLLLEKVEDIPTNNVLYHGTNFYSLLKILLNGYLKPSLYDISLTHKPELSTGRKGYLTTTSPSIGIKGVMIHLYPDRILGSKEHRNVKKTPIAEFVQAYYDDIEAIKKKDKLIKKYYNDLEKLFNRLVSRKNTGYNTVLMAVNAAFKANNNFKKENLKELFITLNSLTEASRNREREERIYFNDKSKKYFNRDKIDYGIKVDPRFMKIEITDIENIKKTINLKKCYEILNEKIKIDDSDDLTALKEIFDLLEKYKDVFFEDSYKKLIEFLKDNKEKLNNET